MKHILLILFLTVTISATAQKTTRNTVSKLRGVEITQRITGADTLYIMLGQNAQYKQVIDIVIVKSGSARDIYALLMECEKFLPEKSGTSLDYQGNTLMIAGKNQLAVYGSDQDERGYIMLRKDIISKLQTDLRGHL